jgi:GNAT superfamily N-acetyltransferase
MNIRIRRPTELDACTAVLAAVHATDGYPRDWPADPHAWLTPSLLLQAWVAEVAAVVVGHVALCKAQDDTAAAVWRMASGLPVDRLAVVSRLFVAPPARGCGLGTDLLHAACAAAVASRRRPALEVLDHDRAAIALYERLGWQRVASAQAAWALNQGECVVVHYYLAPA